MEGQSINPKKSAGVKAVEYVENGMTVGLGTGSTAFWAIQSIAERVAQGLDIRAIATSVPSENLARSLGISIVSFADIDHLDITIDGADEVSKSLNLIKGGGGALLREKIVAAATKMYVIIADHSKYVPILGTFPLPVEVVQFGWQMTVRHLHSLGCHTKMRFTGETVFVSDNGNFIIDCFFSAIEQPAMLHQQINAIPGVVENGLFLGMADIVILGENDGSTRVLRKQAI